jgi:tetratricopeptide (TPR) repeat protein
MTKLIRELRRREVFRTAGLYVGVAWILIEGASVLLDAFEAPDWILRAMIILAIIGLPVTIILAWIFDITEGHIEVQGEATDTAVIPFGGRRMDFVVIGVLAVALVFSVYLNLTSNRQAVVEEIEPLSVLIADFDNQTGDALFDGTLEQALQIGIESAPFITGFGREAARRLAGQLQGEGPLDETAARLVSVREGIKLVMAGSIDEDDGRYRLYVRALDPHGGEVLAEVDADAKDKMDVLMAIGNLSGDLREALGEGDLDRDKLIASETFTAKSIEAAKAYSEAQSLQYQGKYDEAIGFYEQAVELDAEFGRAYSGWALSAQSLGRVSEAAGLWEQALSHLDTMTERERLRTLGLYYILVTRNYPKAIETYRAIVEKYPADSSAHNGLAVQYFYALDFDKAMEEGRAFLDIYPNSAMGRSNYALYAMYASDFDRAVEEAEKVRGLDPTYFKAWLPVAIKALSEDDIEGAVAAYQSMADASSRGAPTSNLGLADAAMFAGRYDDAEALLKSGIAQDRESGAERLVATKTIALAETHVRRQQVDAALEAASRALEESGGDSVLVPAALIYIEAGRLDEARDIAAELSQNLQPQSRAYGRLIEAMLAHADGNDVDAITRLIAAVEMADLWLLRYYLGRLYLESGYAAEALDEFTAADRRRGEAAAVFLDDLPTFRYTAMLPYWMGRAQEALGMQATAQESYRVFVERRPADDPLAADARQRMP